MLSIDVYLRASFPDQLLILSEEFEIRFQRSFLVHHLPVFNQILLDQGSEPFVEPLLLDDFGLGFGSRDALAEDRLVGVPYAEHIPYPLERERIEDVEILLGCGFEP